MSLFSPNHRRRAIHIILLRNHFLPLRNVVERKRDRRSEVKSHFSVKMILCTITLIIFNCIK